MAAVDVDVVVDAEPFDPPDAAWLVVDVVLAPDPIDDELVDVEAVDVEGPVAAIVLVDAFVVPVDATGVPVVAVVFVEALDDVPVEGLDVPLAAVVLVAALDVPPEAVEEPAVAIVFVEAFDVPVDGLEAPAEAVVFVAAFDDPVVAVVLVEVVAVPEAGEDGPPVVALVLVEVLAVPDPPEDAVVELEVEAVAEVVAGFAVVAGLFVSVVCVVTVEGDTGTVTAEVVGGDVVVD